MRPNRFRPEAGVRDRLRTALHETLEDGSVDGVENQTPRAQNNEPQPSTRYTSNTQLVQGFPTQYLPETLVQCFSTILVRGTIFK